MTYLDSNAIIAKEKLTEYLLIRQQQNDKSRFLAQAGYTLENWQQLEQDIRKQILSLEATPTRKTRYGQKYVIFGVLVGLNRVKLKVKTIWIVSDNTTRFVTLFPDKK